MKLLSMHQDSSSRSLMDQRSESSRAAMTSESLVSMTSSSQVRTVSFHSHVEASSSRERLTSELRTGEPPEWAGRPGQHLRRRPDGFCGRDERVSWCGPSRPNVSREASFGVIVMMRQQDNHFFFFQWTHAGRRIPNEERYHVESGADRCVLMIWTVPLEQHAEADQ